MLALTRNVSIHYCVSVHFSTPDLIQHLLLVLHDDNGQSKLAPAQLDNLSSLVIDCVLPVVAVREGGVNHPLQDNLIVFSLCQRRPDSTVIRRRLLRPSLPQGERRPQLQ